ncbi:unnamed protein product [Protopolystoma xenopodis]|uniref:Uncharacterized protein n=1 Tax=Protopolystoma xenopodis TaxID=117903 RepID=A0A448XAB9_9PLAT|nr:unnamed protein product [Protopolystoma xenopodis]
MLPAALVRVLVPGEALFLDEVSSLPPPRQPFPLHQVLVARLLQLREVNHQPFFLQEAEQIVSFLYQAFPRLLTPE